MHRCIGTTRKLRIAISLFVDGLPASCLTRFAILSPEFNQMFASLGAGCLTLRSRYFIHHMSSCSLCCLLFDSEGSFWSGPNR